MSTRRGMRGLFVAAPLLALIATSLSAVAPAKAAAPISGLFLDTSWGYLPNAGSVVSVVGSSQGSYLANFSQYGSPAGAAATIVVTPTDTATDGGSRTFQFEAPPGALLTPGTYTGGSQYFDRSPGVSYFSMSGSTCSSATAVSTFTVYEATFDSNGVPTAFAASFVDRCGASPINYTPLAGEIRFNSSVGIRARDISPVDGINFPITDEGDESASQTVTVTNTGTLPLHPAAAVGDSQLHVQGNCPITLAVSASCTITFASRPTLPGFYSAWLTVVDDSVAGTHLVHATVKGRAHTTTVLTSSVNPDIYPGTVSTMTATITPPPPVGTSVKFYQEGNLYATATVLQNGKATIGYAGYAGIHTVTAAFPGHTYYMPSTSVGISQESFERPTLNLWVSETQGSPDQPVLIESSVARAYGSTQPKGGTVTLTDELTGATYGTYGMADALRWRGACRERLSVGTHRIRATYSGYGSILTATTYIDVVIANGAALVPSPTDPTGDTGVRCASFRAFNEVFPPAPGQYPIVGSTTITTQAFAVTTSPVVETRTSNTQTMVNGLLQPALTRAFGTSFNWSVSDPTYGGVAGSGQHVIWWQLKTQDGRWYGPYPQFVNVDDAPPAGTVAINGGSAYATSTSVTLNVPGWDDLSGPSQVALSNDGVAWTTRTYGASQSWSLPAGDGVKTVYVKWKDFAGHWSGVSTDTITVDTVAPTATAPTYAFISGVGLSSTSTPTKFSWTGADATSGVARYEAAISTDSGAYSTISTSLLSATLTRNLASGHTYRLRVRAVDKAGKTGAYAYGSSFSVSSYQETSTWITYSGTWTRPASTSYWGGYAKYATTAGAKASFTFTGRGYALIGCVGPTRGSFKVYVDGVLIKTVSTYAATTSCQRVLVALSWSTAVSRKVSIVVSGTAGHSRVDLDAIVAAS